MVVLSATIFFLLLRVAVVIAAEEPQLIILIADFGLDDQTGDIYRLNIHHMTISRIPVDVIAPRALDYDHTDGLIYFTDLYTKQIRRVDIIGGNDVEVAKFNSTSSPEGLTLDPDACQAFYTDNGNNLIGRVEMDNFNHTVIVNTGLDKPRGIVADTKNKLYYLFNIMAGDDRVFLSFRKLYWVDFGSNPKIETSDYDGGARTTLIYSGLSDPLEITIDEGAGRLYWSELGGDIESVGVDGRDRRIITTDSDMSPSHMTLFNGYMYYTYFHDSYMVALSLDQKKKSTSLSSAYFKRPRGLHAFTPNFEVTVPCKFGQYGRSCTTCGACLDESLCEKTTGICFGDCQSGYTTEKCTEKCRPGTFGVNCQSTCKCRANSVCDFVTGSCPDGCQRGWKGDNCSIKEPEQDEGPPIGLIAGVVGGVVAVIIIIVVVVVVCVIKRKRAQTKEPEYTSGLSPETRNNDPGYEILNLNIGGVNPASEDIATVY